MPGGKKGSKGAQTQTQDPDADVEVQAVQPPQKKNQPAGKAGAGKQRQAAQPQNEKQHAADRADAPPPDTNDKYNHTFFSQDKKLPLRPQTRYGTLSINFLCHASTWTQILMYSRLFNSFSN